LKPLVFGRFGSSTPSQGLSLTTFAFFSHAKNWLMVCLKFFACDGVLPRRSTPSAIAALVIFDSGWLPALLRTCFMMLSRCRRVDSLIALCYAPDCL
jgi:hypothetical protein